MKEPKPLSPAQTSRIHREVLIAMCRGMGGKIVARVRNTSSNDAIITQATDLKNGSIDVEIILVERGT